MKNLILKLTNPAIFELLSLAIWTVVTFLVLAFALELSTVQSLFAIITCFLTQLFVSKVSQALVSCFK